MDANLIIATLKAGLPGDVIREWSVGALILAWESLLISCLLKALLLAISLSRKKKEQPRTDLAATFQAI